MNVENVMISLRSKLLLIARYSTSTYKKKGFAILPEFDFVECTYDYTLAHVSLERKTRTLQFYNKPNYKFRLDETSSVVVCNREQ